MEFRGEVWAGVIDVQIELKVMRLGEDHHQKGTGPATGGYSQGIV